MMKIETTYIGVPLSAAQRVDASELLSCEEISRALIQRVIDRQPFEAGSKWAGNVTFHFRTDEANVTATVSVWKEEFVEKE